MTDQYERNRIEAEVMAGALRCCAENYCESDEMCYCDPADHAKTLVRCCDGEHGDCSPEVCEDCGFCLACCRRGSAAADALGDDGKGQVDGSR